VELAMPCPD